MTQCREQSLFLYISSQTENQDEEAKAVRVRKYGEVLANCVSSVASALEIPKEMIKDSVRPDYWAKDSESPCCVLCKQLFGNTDDMNQSELFYRESSNGSGSSSNSPVHNVIDIRRHHVSFSIINYHSTFLSQYLLYLKFYSAAVVVQRCATNARLIGNRYLNTDGIQTCVFVIVAGIRRMHELLPLRARLSLRFNCIPFFSIHFKLS